MIIEDPQIQNPQMQTLLEHRYLNQAAWPLNLPAIPA
jgi:hypothetical protein